MVSTDILCITLWFTAKSDMITHISDGLLCLVFSISWFLDSVLHFTLNLYKVTLHLLLGVDEAGVLLLKKTKINLWNFIRLNSCSSRIKYSRPVENKHISTKAERNPKLLLLLLENLVIQSVLCMYWITDFYRALSSNHCWTRGMFFRL